jgi:uncharacterized membrane protein (DUF485 family)
MIELSPGSLPREAIDPSIATLAAQILLFFVVMYFGAFSREAVASPTFPAPGTLFGAFSRSRWTLLVLLLALMTPLGTSLALAAATRKWLFAVPDLFISWAVLTVFVVLETKGYFHALNPRPFLPRYRPVQNATTMSAAATDESKSAEKNSPA